MAIAQINGIDVPYVFALQISRELIAERSRTAGGKMRQDAIAKKRTWRVDTRPMLKSESDLITGEIDSELGGPMEFWLDEFGVPSNTVAVFVTVDNEERVTFARGGMWHNDGRQLSLTVVEQ
jgi:hypothetical protein